MFMQFIYSFFLPFAITTVKEYIKTTETKSDDEVLDLVKVGSKYLAKKTNNTVTNTIADELNKSSIKMTQKSR